MLYLNSKYKSTWLAAICPLCISRKPRHWPISTLVLAASNKWDRLERESVHSDYNCTSLFIYTVGLAQHQQCFKGKLTLSLALFGCGRITLILVIHGKWNTWIHFSIENSSQSLYLYSICHRILSFLNWCGVGTF